MLNMCTSVGARTQVHAYVMGRRAEPPPQPHPARGLL